jgi:hypothetical protein
MVGRPQGVLLGLAPVGGNDGFIGFNTNVQWSYTHTDDPGKFDFVAAALHEITEVLGRTSLVSIDGLSTQYDLFRFASDGSRELHSGTAFFSIDNGTTLLNQFSLIGDDGDWAASSVPNDAFRQMFKSDTSSHFQK